MCVWISLRGIDFAEVGRIIAGARWGVLVGLSVPSYGLLVWARAARWRHLTDPIQPIRTEALARATAVGFMANNLFPLRMGEVIRCWYLGRDTGASTAALFGTVILERTVDTVAVIGMAWLVILFWGGQGDATLTRGALLLLPVAAVPILGLVLLKAAPERFFGAVRWLSRPLPARVAEFLEGALRRFSSGLGALRGGRHLFWIGLHSCVIWLVLSAVPIIAGFLALGIDVGPPGRTLGAAWMTQAAIGVAVALPSAPGFFGVFHAACRFALGRFGVEPELAVAAGTLIHALMWVSLTALGLLVLRLRRTSLEELDAAASASPEPSAQ